MTPSRRNYNQNWLPSIFNDFFDNDWMIRTNATAPAINVTESDKDYKVEVAAPGMTKEDFNIQLQCNSFIFKVSFLYYFVLALISNTDSNTDNLNGRCMS